MGPAVLLRAHAPQAGQPRRQPRLVRPGAGPVRRPVAHPAQDRARAGDVVPGAAAAAVRPRAGSERLSPGAGGGQQGHKSAAAASWRGGLLMMRWQTERNSTHMLVAVLPDVSTLHCTCSSFTVADAALSASAL